MESYSFLPSTASQSTIRSRICLFVDKGLLNTLIMKTGFFTRHSRADAEWDSPRAFFRNLSVCSPPASTISVRIRYFKNPNDVEKVVRCAIRSSSGVTLGELWDSIVRTMRAAARASGRNRPELDLVEVSTGAGGSFEWTRGMACGGAGSYVFPDR